MAEYRDLASRACDQPIGAMLIIGFERSKGASYLLFEVLGYTIASLALVSIAASSCLLPTSGCFADILSLMAV